MAALALLALLVLAAAAIIPGSHSSGTTRFGVARITRATSGANTLPYHERKVFGSNIAAGRYGTLIGDQENEGVNAQGQLASDLPPLSPRAFNAPVAAYKRYAEHWSVKLGQAVDTLRSGLESDDRGVAQREWTAAFSDYLHLGAVYGLLPTGLDHRLAANPTNLADPHFTGLHRIELGLWTGAPPRSLVPVAASISRAVPALLRVLPGTAIDPLDYATRAHEVLEDAQRDFMSGTEVPWSGAGVMATDAGLIATKEVISTLVPLLQGRDNTLIDVQNWLLALQTALDSVRRPDGTWPSLNQLTMIQRERINGTLAGALSALELVPGTLETVNVPVIPTIAQQAHAEKR
ncbi:MAG TPA: EfeM/EfeO family lipoprotein [Solirubrobacteraceae bacterium]|nr:EfeM/EfeO family lipoprotein [Solirubrobacteraceae bacterium]